MALATLSDYQLFVNQLFYYLDQNFSGIDHNGLYIYAGMNQADFQQALAAYMTYKKTRKARPATQEVAPNAHGANKTVFETGGGETKVAAPAPHF